MRTLVLVLVTCCLNVPVVGQQQDINSVQRSPDKNVAARQLIPLSRVAPAPTGNPTTREKVALGKQLFFDPRLSGDNTMSCATCHVPDKAFGDGVPLGSGHQAKTLRRNTQSCLNVGFLETFFWDGRATSLEEQALIPIQAADEMNQDLDELEQELNAIPAYVRQFSAAFGVRPDRDGVAKALAAYQRTLVTDHSPFDRFLLGEKDAMSKQAKEGLDLFRGSAGCIECHHGPLLSDNQFHRLGVSHRDEGRAEVTGKREDRFRFRTPSLRNVAETGPYMHNGKLQTLDDVVTFYFRGIPDTGPDGLTPDMRALSDQSFSSIPLLVEFLKSLTGRAPDFTPPLLPGIVAGEPDTWVSTAQPDTHGFLVHHIESPYQRGTTDLRVLLPDSMDSQKQYSVVYVLPVEAGRESSYGDGLLEVKNRDLHNKFEFIFAAPSFSDLPWYADHPTDQAKRQESYFVNIVVPLVEQMYPASQRCADRLLLGFSKSGWGAWTLLLRHPEVFGRAAAWDAPLAMQEVGKYGTKPIFGTAENFDNYRVTQLLRNRADLLQDEMRLLLVGSGNFRSHHQQVHELADRLNIAVAYRDGPSRKHDWHSGWVADAVALLKQAKPTQTNE